MTGNAPRRGALLVALGMALLALPFLGSLPLFDPDEGFYPAAAAESLRHGHPLDLTLNGEPRWNKPPLSYALMQGSFLVLGRSEFAARLPSVLEAAALVWILGLAVGSVAGRRAGVLASLVLASTVGVQLLGRAAHPEMALVLGTATAQLLLALWWVAPAGGRPRWMPLAAGLAMGFGFLAKGPSVLVHPVLMLAAGLLVLPREGRPGWAEAGRAFGGAAAVALALAAPWFLWMGARHGEAFWSTALGQLGHFAGGDIEKYGDHPLYFLPVLLGGFLPWTLFLPWALRGLRRSDPSPAARFRLLMALAAGTSLLFWSLSDSKLPNYGLVFLPPLAALAGTWFDGAWGGAARGAAPGARHPWDVRAPRSVALLAGLAAWLFTAAVALAAATGSGDLLTTPGRAFSRAILAGEGGRPVPVAVYRRRLPSLSFYLQREVPWPHDEGALREFLAGPGTRYLVIQDRHMGLLPPGGEVEGYATHSVYWLVRFGPRPPPR